MSKKHEHEQKQKHETPRCKCCGSHNTRLISYNEGRTVWVDCNSCDESDLYSHEPRPENPLGISVKINL